MDANNRYEMLGQKLADRHSELELTQRTVSQYSDELRSLSAWFDDKEQITLPLTSLSANEQEATEKLREHQVWFTIGLICLELVDGVVIKENKMCRLCIFFIKYQTNLLLGIHLCIKYC